MQYDGMALSLWVKNLRNYDSIVKPALVTLLVVFPLIAITIAIRRATESFSQPLSVSTLLLTGLTIALLASGPRFLMVIISPIRSQHHWLQKWLVVAITTLSIATIAVAVSLPETTGFALAIFWLILITEEYVSISWFLKKQNFDQLKLPLTNTASNQIELAVLPESQQSIEHADTMLELPEGVTQQLTRHGSPISGEVLSGLLRAEFDPKQRSATIHVGFCPPFLELPEVQVHQLQGPTAKIKVAQRLHQGVRIELRLTTAYDEMVDVIVEMIATVEANDRSIEKSSIKK